MQKQQVQQSQFPPTISFPENKIGKHTKIGNCGYIGHNTTIGMYCTIGNNVTIALPEYPTKYLTTSGNFYLLHTKNGVRPSNAPDDPFVFENFKGCTIGNDVLIENNVVIADGVTIGDGAVIHANSTVNVDVPPYAIVAGTPARIIKFRFSPELIERLMNIKWWELPQEMLTNLPYRVESAVNTLEQRIKISKK